MVNPKTYLIAAIVCAAFTLLDGVFVVLEFLQEVTPGVIISSSVSTVLFLYFGIRFFLRSSVMEKWYDSRMPLAERLTIHRDNALAGVDK